MVNSQTEYSLNNKKSTEIEHVHEENKFGFWSNLDFFAEPIAFMYKGKRSNPSVIGGIVSLIVILLLVAYFVYLLLEMIMREHPLVVIKTIVSDIPDEMIINPYVESDKNFTTNWQNSFEIYQNVVPTVYVEFDNSLLKFNLEEVTIENGKINRRPIKNSMCTKYGNFDQNTITANNLTATYCIDEIFSIKGIAGRENSSYLEARIAMCDFDQSAKCKSKSQVMAYANNLYSAMYFENPAFTIAGVEQNTTIEQYFWEGLTDFTKMVTIELGIDTLYFYDGYFPDFFDKNYNKTDVLVVRGMKMDLRDLDQDKNLLIIKIIPSRIKYEYRRYYKDILWQIAMLGGITIIVIIFGFVIVYSFTKFRLDESMMNSFYNLIHPKHDKEISKNFRDFLKERYNFLFNKFLIKNKKNMQNLYNLNISEKNSPIVLEKISLNIQTEINDKTKFNQKEILFSVFDDERLITDSENELKKYFTLKRIESIFDFTMSDRLVKLKEISQNTSEDNLIDRNINFFKFLFMKENGDLTKITVDFYILESAYEVFKYENNDKFEFSFYEMFLKIFCKCCLNKKKSKV